MMLDKTHVLREQSATHELKKGQIIFASILSIKNQKILVSMAPMTFDFKDYSAIKDVKKWLIAEKNNRTPLTAESLHQGLDMDLLDNFFEWKIQQTSLDHLFDD